VSDQADAKLARFFHRLDQVGDQEVVDLPQLKSWPPARHRFDETDLWAIRAALAAGRPLLVRGEPGIGKSQLARAAAHVLQLPFLYKVIDARCECSDLLYEYDAVSRLAQAQVVGQVDAKDDWREQLLEARFVRPAILWWAFDWQSAHDQAKRYNHDCRSCENDPCQLCVDPTRPADWNHGDGCVVLIDEIDKADTAVPNGLLEALGNMGFDVPSTGEAVAMAEDAAPPLVVVTTNEERELPAAFLRRCLVHQMSMDQHKDGELGFLLSRGRDHFGDQIADPAVYQRAADQILEDRRAFSGQGAVKPGAAEYIDLLRALTKLCPLHDPEKQLAALAKIERFAVDKSSRELGW
jgi:MoxR-like ATPase